MLLNNATRNDITSPYRLVTRTPACTNLRYAAFTPQRSVTQRKDNTKIVVVL